MKGGDDYLSVDCVLHVLCYASVLELVQCTCVRTSDSAFKGISKSYGMELIILAILGGQI